MSCVVATRILSSKRKDKNRKTTTYLPMHPTFSVYPLVPSHPSPFYDTDPKKRQPGQVFPGYFSGKANYHLKVKKSKRHQTHTTGRKHFRYPISRSSLEKAIYKL